MKKLAFIFSLCLFSFWTIYAEDCSKDIVKLYTKNLNAVYQEKALLDKHYNDKQIDIDTYNAYIEEIKAYEEAYNKALEISKAAYNACVTWDTELYLIKSAEYDLLAANFDSAIKNITEYLAVADKSNIERWEYWMEVYLLVYLYKMDFSFEDSDFSQIVKDADIALSSYWSENKYIEFYKWKALHFMWYPEWMAIMKKVLNSEEDPEINKFFLNQIMWLVADAMLNPSEDSTGIVITNFSKDDNWNWSLAGQDYIDYSELDNMKPDEESQKLLTRAKTENYFESLKESVNAKPYNLRKWIYQQMYAKLRIEAKNEEGTKKIMIDKLIELVADEIKKY